MFGCKSKAIAGYIKIKIACACARPCLLPCARICATLSLYVYTCKIAGKEQLPSRLLLLCLICDLRLRRKWNDTQDALSRSRSRSRAEAGAGVEQGGTGHKGSSPVDCLAAVASSAKRLPKEGGKGRRMSQGNPYMPIICRTSFHFPRTRIVGRARITIWLVIGYDCHGPNTSKQQKSQSKLCFQATAHDKLQLGAAATRCKPA